MGDSSEKTPKKTLKMTPKRTKVRKYKPLVTFRKDVKTPEENKTAKEAKKDMKEVIKNNKDALEIMVKDNKSTAERMEVNMEKIGDKLTDLIRILIINQQIQKDSRQTEEPPEEKIITEGPATKQKRSEKPAIKNQSDERKTTKNTAVKTTTSEQPVLTQKTIEIIEQMEDDMFADDDEEEKRKPENEKNKKLNEKKITEEKPEKQIAKPATNKESLNFQPCRSENCDIKEVVIKIREQEEQIEIMKKQLEKIETELSEQRKKPYQRKK